MWGIETTTPTQPPFIQDCIDTTAQGQGAILEVVQEALNIYRDEFVIFAPYLRETDSYKI